MHFLAGHLGRIMFGAFYIGDLAVAAFVLSENQLGQGALAILVAIVGFVLNHKSKQIHILVNSQMTRALERIDDLEKKLALKPGEAIPAESIVTPVTSAPVGILSDLTSHIPEPDANPEVKP